MTTFTFNTNDYRRLYGDILEGKTVSLTKPNGATIQVTADFNETLTLYASVQITTPEGQQLYAADVFEARDLRRFLQGQLYTQYNVA